MQSASSRIWTRAAVSISYDDNHYTMGTSTMQQYINLVDSEELNTIKYEYWPLHAQPLCMNKMQHKVNF